ncbi:unnamed protein product [Hydatigera taeniaeformis]|uniref:Transcription elongation factor SPT4 n=1 Tax=Hydatigena taeniaeformis TaxID=6205 RepID=A0A0R3WPI6_HYDTA|nr:unnamed protein product [Hydatigera taeniaeformis]
MDMQHIIPTDLRQLRACLLCGLIKTMSQFEMNGCENCEDYLNLQGDRESVYECTSNNFDGMVAMMNPSESWVARWLRIDKLTPGVYAMSVSGKLSKSRIDHLRSRGLEYQSRDRSKA